jgi:hypothetical protein
LAPNKPFYLRKNERKKRERKEGMRNEKVEINFLYILFCFIWSSAACTIERANFLIKIDGINMGNFIKLITFFYSCAFSLSLL